MLPFVRRYVNTSLFHLPEWTAFTCGQMGSTEAVLKVFFRCLAAQEWCSVVYYMRNSSEKWSTHTVNTFINIKRCNWATRLLRKSEVINCGGDIHFYIYKTKVFLDQLHNFVTAQCGPFTMVLVLLHLQKWLVGKWWGILVAWLNLGL